MEKRPGAWSRPGFAEPNPSAPTNFIDGAVAADIDRCLRSISEPGPDAGRLVEYCTILGPSFRTSAVRTLGEAAA